MITIWRSSQNVISLLMNDTIIENNCVKSLHRIENFNRKKVMVTLFLISNYFNVFSNKQTIFFSLNTTVVPGQSPLNNTSWYMFIVFHTYKNLVPSSSNCKLNERKRPTLLFVAASTFEGQVSHYLAFRYSSNFEVTHET